MNFYVYLTISIILFNYCSNDPMHLVNAQGPFTNALFLGDPLLFNSTRDDCIWKRGNDRDECPDEDIKMFLYTNDLKRYKVLLDTRQTDWLRNSGWNPEYENIIMIHGYGSGEKNNPMAVLRDAYLHKNQYNVFMVDWGVLCAPPCYVAAVHNMKSVAKCLAFDFSFLRHSGMQIGRTTCVGHSLGAHICGLMSNYLNFRIERIIGLDPARPLIKSGNAHRLDIGDAKSVQIIHTNAGHYGEPGKMGHIDFCINGGKNQPYCDKAANENLCSHLWSICYLAESLFDSGNKMEAEPCNRRCPFRRKGRRNQFTSTIGNTVKMGQFTPINAIGSYCLKDYHVPFCPTSEDSIGDKRCCVGALNGF